jgi:Rieske Fe-S protein
MLCTSCNRIARREFLERTLALLGVSGLIACSGGIITAPAIMAFTVKITDFPALASVGGIAVVDNGSRSGSGDPIAVTRTGQATFLALSLICPHRGVTVEISGPGFFCPGHGAMFAADGSWTGGQPTSNLSSYKISYDQTAGTLQIG